MASEIRVNKINNRAGLGTITIADTGVIVNGIVTCTEISGLNALNIAGVSTFASPLDINGDIDVDGHTNLDNLSVAGVATFSSVVNANSFAGNISGTTAVFDDFLDVGSNIKLGNAGVITATSYRGDGSQLTGIVAGLSTISGVVNVVNDLDVDGHTNLDNVSIAGITTFSDRAYLAHDLTITGTAPRVIFTDTNNNSDYRINVDAGNFEVQDVTNSFATRLRISSTGKVNIGDTQTSQNILNIEDGTAASMEFASHGTGGDTAYIGVKKSAGGGLTFGVSNRDIIFKTGASYSGGTAFDGGTERLRIDSSGRMMIGNTNASTMFGGADDLVVGNTSGAHGITIITSNSTVGRLLFSDSTSSAPAIYQGQINYNHSTDELDLRTYTGGSITFATGNAEKARITSNGNLSINTTADVQKLRVYDSRGAAGYKTALFESNDTANGTRIVIANTGNTSGRGLGINVGGQTYGPGQDRASFGWYNPDNTFSNLSVLTIDSNGVMAHGPFASFAYDNLPGLFNVHSGARVNTGGANQFAAPKGGFVDNSRYELEAALITVGGSQGIIQAVNGARLYINNGRTNWSYYNNLPNYLLGHPATDAINVSNYSVTLRATMTVFLQRTNGWNAVPLTGWELLESDTNIYPGNTDSRLYVKTFAAGSYTFDSDSAMYFFML